MLQHIIVELMFPKLNSWILNNIMGYYKLTYQKVMYMVKHIIVECMFLQLTLLNS